ncbi:MAG TPA: tRNA lysidine(34) synthetase TilS, partial [Candidatus Ventrisoma faecale]|nr:tRNA lysidine(34) synthetase TilS [Candidatus Ventrisoma faecale]
MRERFLTYIRENDMLDPGGRVIVALSGGGDSVCLLHLLASCREELETQLLAVHVHHGIRGDEAGRDASFARALCERLGVPFILRREDVPELAARRGLSLEEAGRETRYRIFEEERLRCGASCVAVAHHMDDSAETILNNLFRGTGLAGLSGIAPVRGTVIRPLLCFRRQEIEHYLEAEGIEYCSDST